MTLGRLFFTLVVIAACALAGQRRAIGQSTTGSIQGIVTDNTGAVLVGASVRVVNLQTGITQTAGTNDRGFYLFAALPPGQYVVHVEHPGFSSVSTAGIDLHIDQKIQQDFALKVGAATEKVEVNASNELLETQAATVGEVINYDMVQDLPTLGRAFLNLSLLSPGVVPGPSNSDDPTSNYSINGSREFGDAVLMDGIIVNSNRQQTVDILPSLESVQEFKVLSGSFNADIGEAGGGVTSIQTKSGTNQFHGDLYEYFRPPETTADQFFSTVPTNYRQNNFGATIGGPIIREKTFFFLAHEEQYGHNSTPVIASVPPAGQIKYNANGSVDLSGLLDPYTGQQVPLFNPYAYATTYVPTRFPNNLIPANLISKSGLNVMQELFPAPNAPGLLNGYINNFKANQSVYTKSLLYDARFDHSFSERNRLSLIAHYSWLYGDYSDPFAGKIPIPDGGFAEGEDLYKAPNIVVALPWTYAFSSTLLNEFRLGYRNYYYTSPDPTDSRNPDATLGFGNIAIPGYIATTGIPSVNFGGDLGPVGGSDYQPLIFRDSNWQVNDDVTKVLGDHQLKAGFQFRHLSARPLYSVAPKGYFYVGGPYINQTGDPTYSYYNGSAFYPNGGSDIADELLGIPYEVELGLQLDNPHTLAQVYSGYVQDTWRATNTLTLNYGVRYDLFTPWVEQNNRAANFSLSSNELLVAGTGGNSRSLVNTEYKDFGPRFGVDYQLNDRTVVRAGYGLSYTPEDDARSQDNAFNYPFQQIQVYINSPGAALPFTYLQDTGIPRSTKIPLSSGQSTITISQIQNSTLNALSEVNPHYPIGYVQSYNLSAERRLVSQLTLDVGYVGDVSRHLGYQIGNLNYLDQISSQLGVVSGLSAVGSSNYNSLQVKVNGRLGSSLDLLTSYTYGKNLGNTEPPLDPGVSGAYPQNPFNIGAEYGPDAADVKQVISVSFLYQLPFGQGKRFLGNASSLEDAMVGGWQLNGIVTGRTGLPFNVADSRGTGKDLTLRPNQIGNPFPSGFTQNYQHWFSASAFSDKGLSGLTPGDTRRNSLRGPDYNDLDFSLFKVFTLREQLKLQMRVESFNLFNHPNFGQPSSNISSATVGTINSTTGNPRIMQFAAKLIF